MRIKFLFILIILSILDLSAQLKFISVRINQLYNLLPQTCKNEVGKYDMINYHFKNVDNVIKVMSENGEITHIGLNIFDDIDSGFYPKQVFEFIESYLYEMLFTNDINDFYKRSKEQNILVLINGSNIQNSIWQNSINRLLTSNSLTYKKIEKDSLFYVFTVSDSINNIKVRFPANNSLVCGMDKKELDNLLELKLNKYVNSVLSTDSIYQDQYFEPIKEIFKLRGDVYYNNITSDKYFLKNDGEFKWLYDEKYLKESLANTFIKGSFANAKKVNVWHCKYGNNSSKYTIKLNDFLGFFQSQNCKMFFGIESETPDKLQATLVIYNPFLNFINIVYINTTADGLFDLNKNIDLKLYSNIPSDNIKDLFGVY